MCHMTLTTPFLGMTCHQQATINLQTKFDVYSYNCYEDMKSDAKCKNRGGLGQLGSLKVLGNVTIR